MTIEIIDHNLYPGASCNVTIEVTGVEMVLTDEGLHVYSQRFNSGTIDNPCYDLMPYSSLGKELTAIGELLKEAYEDLHAQEEFDDDGEQIEEVADENDRISREAEDDLQALLEDPKVAAWLMELAL